MQLREFQKRQADENMVMKNNNILCVFLEKERDPSDAGYGVVGGYPQEEGE